MKKYVSILSALLLSLTPVMAQNNDWRNDKYSMFIHFGLYSHLGGVWEGEQISRGYSEQIQGSAGIFSDRYAAEAARFDPVEFDADMIASLAKEGGMRSIVFTSKHHDGFCMFDTRTTSYNSVAMTPSHRDYIKELSQACEKYGLRMGLYFSLIDWNYPYAYPISSHNSDFITPEHHEFSKAQIRELLTNYGPVSELWFDMGALQPQQSRELYELVKELQPECMVSGRLGNDVYDFAVMGDNRLPESALQAPWQTAASMFDETWGYRSWQHRPSAEDKYAEKLRSLINVVSHGGNYLLNIGPASDGSVVPFEAEVITRIGRWLKDNGEAIYGVNQAPFRNNGFDWGQMTVKDNVMYLLLTGSYPEDGIHIDAGVHPVSVDGAGYQISDGTCCIEVTEDMFGHPDVKVIKVEYERPVTAEMFPHHFVTADPELAWNNAIPDYSYSCFDYYSNYRSTVGYGWNVLIKRPASAIELTYTAEEVGRKVQVGAGDIKIEVVLENGKEVAVSTEGSVGEFRFGRMRGMVFDDSVSLDKVTQWNDVPSGSTTVESVTFSNYLMTAQVMMQKASKVVLDVTAGNGVELLVDGKTMMKHLNPYRTIERTEKVLLDLPKGSHEIVLRSYNRFEKSACAALSLAEDQKVYTMRIPLPEKIDEKEVMVTLAAADNASPHTDCGLHNVIVRLVK